MAAACDVAGEAPASDLGEALLRLRIVAAAEAGYTASCGLLRGTRRPAGLRAGGSGPGGGGRTCDQAGAAIEGSRL